MLLISVDLCFWHFGNFNFLLIHILFGFILTLRWDSQISISFLFLNLFSVSYSLPLAFSFCSSLSYRSLPLLKMNKPVISGVSSKSVIFTYAATHLSIHWVRNLSCFIFYFYIFLFLPSNFLVFVRFFL